MSLSQLSEARSEHPALMIARPCILVVEDDAMVRELLCDVLEESYRVIGVAQSREALLKLAHQRIDVILLDYGLPGGGAEEIAKRADQRGVPMIWLTGDPAAVRMLHADNHLLLVKPFSIDRVLGALTKVRLSERAFASRSLLGVRSARR
jgi:two-component system, OmpR family, phosphate regulon response regulator PhoB